MSMPWTDRSPRRTELSLAQRIAFFESYDTHMKSTHMTELDAICVTWNVREAVK